MQYNGIQGMQNCMHIYTAQSHLANKQKEMTAMVFAYVIFER